MGDEGKIQKEYYCWKETSMGLPRNTWNRYWFIFAHSLGAYGFYLIFTGQLPWQVVSLVILQGYIAGLGITAGSHRLWCHRTYKAKLPLRILFALMTTTSVQHSLLIWCRHHRLHHKYVDTDADPNDSRRDFWWTHIGWLITEEHPDVQKKMDSIDFSDLDSDPVVRFQFKYYWLLVAITVFAIPMSIVRFLAPYLSFLQVLSLALVPVIISLHFALIINSIGHRWGPRPYDGGIRPRENLLVSLLAFGEGWHNYHHVFPWDYRTAEVGVYKFNPAALIIDFFAWIGWAHDLKTVPKQLVYDRVKRTGDGTHIHSKEINAKEHLPQDEGTSHTWGWGDSDISQQHYDITLTLNPTKKSK